MPTFPAIHVSVAVERSPADVAAFAGDPANLPRWAQGLGAAVEQVEGEWVADSPMGKVKVRFAAPNAFGVLDHDVVLPSGERVHNPMRVVPNGTGSEVTFTLLRRAGVSDEEFAADRDAVARDLAALKVLLEDGARERDAHEP